jgi:hypothetical protein
MASGLLLSETMSGDMTLDDNGVALPFSFSIHAFSKKILNISSPRYFHGTVTLDGNDYPCHGELTIHLTGPHYWLEFDHPQLGAVRAEGQKSYSLKGLVRSLTTCPLQISVQGRRIGTAVVAYQDSMLAFPFKALRLVDEQYAPNKTGSTQ